MSSSSTVDASSGSCRHATSSAPTPPAPTTEPGVPARADRGEGTFGPDPHTAVARTLRVSQPNGGTMFKTLVVALDLEADGDRALPVVRALSRAGTVAVDLVTVSSPGLPAAADAYELEHRAVANGWDCGS